MCKVGAIHSGTGRIENPLGCAVTVRGVGGLDRPYIAGPNRNVNTQNRNGLGYRIWEIAMFGMMVADAA